MTKKEHKEYENSSQKMATIISKNYLREVLDQDKE